MYMITDLALPIHVALSPLGYVKLPIRPFEISVQCVILQEGGLIGALDTFFGRIKKLFVWYDIQNYSSSAYHRC